MIPDLQMANFNTDPEVQFDLLLELQPDKPLMAMEYWSGWFDHWFEPGHNEGNSPQSKFCTNTIYIYFVHAISAAYYNKIPLQKMQE